MGIGDLILMVFIGWAIWRGYQSGLAGVLFQWLGLFLSLMAVWYIQQTHWWTEWGREGTDFPSSFLWKWGLLAGILVGIQLLLMATARFLNSIFQMIGLNLVNRWVGALLVSAKWVVIFSLSFYFFSKVSFCLNWLRLTFPLSSDWWIGMGSTIWSIFN